jgi:hypothetical protein
MSAELTSQLRGRAQMVLTYVDATGDRRPLVSLHRRVSEDLGPASRLALHLEYALEELLSRSRPVAESARVWTDLHARAEAALDPQDTALMPIKALHARFTRLSGGPEDRDAAVDSYEIEWRRRLGIFGPQAHRTSTAHANLATALRERGRPADLRRACYIARAELAVRTAAWGADNSFTWIADIVLAQALLRLAELGDEARVQAGGPEANGAAGPAGYPPVEVDDVRRPVADLVAEALDRASRVLTARRERYGQASRPALRAQLVHAHARLLAGQPSAAADEIRHVLATNRRVTAQLDPGWPELLLARALLASSDDGVDALRQAREAVLARRDRYPAGTDRLAEAERLEGEARRAAGNMLASYNEDVGDGPDDEPKPDDDTVMTESSG